MQRKHILTGITTAVMIILAVSLHLLYQRYNADRTVKVGFIYISDESTPYTANFLKAQESIRKKFGDKVRLIPLSNIAEGNHGAALNELVNYGCDIIFTTSYGYGDTTKEFARQYPNIQFCQATCSNANEGGVVKNYHTFMGAIHEGRYITGVLAGMKLKEFIDNDKLSPEMVKIGYVAAYPYAEVISGYTAFFLGVREIVPQATMVVKYANTWSSYVIEKRIAKELIDEGCIIISQHSDTEGPAVACETVSNRKTVYHVGYNNSMLDIAPTTSLVSSRINWEPYMVAAVEAVIKGKNIEDNVKARIIGNDACGSFAENWVEIIGLNDVIANKNSRNIIRKYTEAFKKGNQEVFRGNYRGVNPEDPLDVIDLRHGYQECKNGSAPSFNYVLDDVIKIERSSEKFGF